MNNSVSYTSILFSRSIKRYIVPVYSSITELGVKEKPEPLTRKLMNKAIIMLTGFKNVTQPNLSISTEHI